MMNILFVAGCYVVGTGVGAVGYAVCNKEKVSRFINRRMK